MFPDRLEQVTPVGRPSDDGAGQPILHRLPGGGFAAKCAKRDTHPDDRDFVGYGVQPDVYAAPTRRSIIDGTDPVLEKGTRHGMLSG